MEIGKRTAGSATCFVAMVAALSAPAMGQTSTGQGAATVPPVVVTTTKPSPPKKAVAVKKSTAPKKASAPKPTPAPEPVQAEEAPPPPPSTEVQTGSLGLPPISTTSYFVGIAKSALSPHQAANPASVTVVRYSEETTRLVRDYQSLLKPITGVTANDFDQGGVGFGLTLRGFSERSNGSNVAIYIDGVPVNQSSHRLSNGYGDLSPLIPELIDSFELTRGPFDVRAGASALAGSAHYTTADEPTSGILAKGGSFEYKRGIGVYSFGAGEVRGYGSLVASDQSGYRDNTDWEQYNTFNKVLFPMLDGTGALRFQLYDSDFESPGFINRAKIENGTIDEKDARNPTDGGDNQLQNLVFNYKQKGDEPITALAYVSHNDHLRIASRQGSAAFPDATQPVPANTPGIQFITEDDRIAYGATIDKYFRADLPYGMGVDLLVGGGVQRDEVDSTEFRSVGGRKTIPNGTCTSGTLNATTGRSCSGVGTATNALVDFDLTNPFGYAQSNFKPFSWLKLTAGLRFDQMYFDIEDRTDLNKGVNRVSAGIDVWQPKYGATVTPFPGFDIFVNYGEGFRPPSVIGNQLLRDPNTPESTLETSEVGIQYNSPDGRWHFLASTYYTTFSNEIVFNAALAQPVSLGPSIREGYDIEGRVLAYRADKTALSLYASYSKIDNRLTDPRAGGTVPLGQPDNVVIPDIADFFVKYGFDLTVPLGGAYSPHLLTLSAGQVWEGPKSLDAQKIFGKTETFSRIDAGLTYTNEDWKGFSVFLDGIFYPDKRFEETAFVFGSGANRTVGVSPKAPVTVQGGVFIPF